VEATEYKIDAEVHHENLEKAQKAGGNRNKLDWRHPGHAQTDDTPVTQVTWRDAIHFCNWLSEQEKLKACYARDATGSWILLAAGDGYRLPTEAEWEFACRAGTTTPYSFDAAARLDDFAWYGANAGGRPQPVGLKRPNPFGLYDVHGTVLEWCHDWYAADYYANSPRTNPYGADSGTAHVARGGSWFDPQGNACRSAFRLVLPARNNRCGFRLARITIRPDGAHDRVAPGAE
jgi:formylglycine-generating enzyme required for sulfatase activity